MGETRCRFASTGQMDLSHVRLPKKLSGDICPSSFMQTYLIHLSMITRPVLCLYVQIELPTAQVKLYNTMMPDGRAQDATLVVWSLSACWDHA